MPTLLQALFILLNISLFACRDHTAETSKQNSSPHKPATQRYLSLHPSITETFYALDATEVLKGRSDFCAYPEIAKTLPHYGSSITPAYEAIARDQFDLILGDNSIENNLGNLSEIAKVEIYPWLTIDDMMTSIERLGVLTQRSDAASILVKQLKVAFSPASIAPTRVLLLLSGSEVEKGQLWFIKPESLHGELLRAAGYSNAAKDKLTPLLSLEELFQMNPDIILVFADATADQEALQRTKQQILRFDDLTAVKNQQVCIYQAQNAFGTGPSIVDQIIPLHERLNTCKE